MNNQEDTTQAIRLNTLFDLSFQLIHECEPQDVPAATLLQAAQQRLDYLAAHPDDAAEAFGIADSYQEEDDDITQTPADSPNHRSYPYGRLYHR